MFIIIGRVVDRRQIVYILPLDVSCRLLPFVVLLAEMADNMT